MFVCNCRFDFFNQGVTWTIYTCEFFFKKSIPFDSCLRFPIVRKFQKLLWFVFDLVFWPKVRQYEQVWRFPSKFQSNCSFKEWFDWVTVYSESCIRLLLNRIFLKCYYHWFLQMFTLIFLGICKFDYFHQCRNQKWLLERILLTDYAYWCADLYIEILMVGMIQKVLMLLFCQEFRSSFSLTTDWFFPLGSHLKALKVTKVFWWSKISNKLLIKLIHLNYQTHILSWIHPQFLWTLPESKGLHWRKSI